MRCGRGRKMNRYVLAVLLPCVLAIPLVVALWPPAPFEFSWSEDFQSSGESSASETENRWNADPDPFIWPLPREYTLPSTQLALAADFQFVTPAGVAPSSTLQAACSRYRALVLNHGPPTSGSEPLLHDISIEVCASPQCENQCAPLLKHESVRPVSEALV